MFFDCTDTLNREDYCKFLTDSFSDKANDNFIFLFFSLIHRLYPLTHLTPNQLKAMKTASPDYTVPSFREKCYDALLILTADL